MVSLFDPIQVGSIAAKNRVWMSPLTRARADRQHVPTDIMVEYYIQRAKAGLIISEAVGISRQGLGTPYAPGIWNSEQVDAWKKITSAIHAHGGKIVAQLWHMGRNVHSSVTGEQPVSSSATASPREPHTYEGKAEPETARALTVPEIKQIVQTYVVAAKNAIDAGFDGVQIHSANGYLLEQFLKNSDNHRTDEYGGSIENRARFLEEVLAAVTEAIGSERTAVRLSPNGEVFGIRDSAPKELATELAKRLNKYNLAFLELREAVPDTYLSSPDEKLHAIYNELYEGPLVLNQQYTRAQAEEALAQGIASAISFGRAFISNPDLVEKIRHKDDDWTKDDVSTWYRAGAKGYIDYPIRYQE